MHRRTGEAILKLNEIVGSGLLLSCRSHGLHLGKPFWFDNPGRHQLPFVKLLCSDWGIALLKLTTISARACDDSDERVMTRHESKKFRPASGEF
jgi:hypothetical protein